MNCEPITGKLRATFPVLFSIILFSESCMVATLAVQLLKCVCIDAIHSGC